ncbi:MAG: hypothetical protein FJ144_26235 [Deltaproteobacteria bacterium]|nr:hypothetical protein [Deltaproteobacteria bacterium]
MSQSSHPTEMIQDLLDGRLGDEARRIVEAHVDGCELCQRDLAAIGWVKQTLQTHRDALELPAGLDERVSEALSRVDEETASERRPSPRSLTRRTALAAGVALALTGVAVALLGRGRGRKPALVPDEIALDYRRFVETKPPLGLATADPKALEEFFASRGIDFKTRVFDLGMMGFHLLGGTVHEVAGQPSALFVYRTDSGRIVICQMFPGRIDDLPAGVEIRQEKGIEFRIFDRGGVTMVFWPEGGVVCVLAGDIAREELVQLAIAKAEAAEELDRRSEAY